MANIKQKDLPKSKRNSRVFTFRLNNQSDDVNEVEARYALDKVWNKSDKDKKRFIIQAILLGSENEYKEPSELVRGLQELTDDMKQTQDRQSSLIRSLQEQINNFQSERKLIRSLLAKLKDMNFNSYKQATHEILDESDDVHPDLKDSLFSLLED